MRYLLYAFVVLCVLWEPLTLAQEEDVLDIVKAQQLKPEKEKRTRKSNANDKPKFVTPKPVVGVTHMPPAPKLFNITLLSLDKQSYRLGEQCIYEIRLENITNDPIAIPWSPYSDDVKPIDDDKDPPGYLKARVSLIIIDGTSEKLISGVSISGSNLARGSLKTLKPKESVRIRVPGRFAPGNLTDEQEMAATLPRKVEVRAYYHPTERTFNWPRENSLSTNALTIELKKNTTAPR